MLVLSRKKNELIFIGKDIVVTTVEIRGDKVRIGIEAPSNVPVHREEVAAAIAAEMAAGTSIETRTDRLDLRENLEREARNG